MKNARDPRLPPAGTELRREWDGKVYRVRILSEGFIYNRRVYPSITKVAKAVTGRKGGINGFRFFGLAGKGPGPKNTPTMSTDNEPPKPPPQSKGKYRPKDRVMLRTPFGEVFGVISWSARDGYRYNILTAQGMLWGRDDDLRLITGDRPEDDVMGDIAGCYNALSPENLTCDGEASASHIRYKKAALHRLLSYLFAEIGREVPEDEANNWALRQPLVIPGKTHKVTFKFSDKPGHYTVAP